MRHFLVLLWLVALMLSIPLGRCAADDKDSWVGKTVFPKNNDIHFGVTRDGEDVDFGRLEGVTYKVVAEEGKRIKVRQRDKEGWLAKDDAVPLDKAVDYFTDQIRANDKDAVAHQARGTAWYLREKLDSAIKDFDEAIRLDPTAAAYWNSRGSAWDDKKEYDKAIKDYDEAIRLDPKIPYIYYNRGRAWHNKNEYQKAIKDYDEAIDLYPEYVMAFVSRGIAWSDKKEYDKAIKDYDEAIRLDPMYGVSFNNRGEAWRHKKEYQKAIQDYNEALRINPKHSYALASKAYLMATCPDEKFRDGKKALELAKQACELGEWKNGWFLMILGAAHAELGHFDEAVKWQMKALENKTYASDGDEKAKAEKRLKLYIEKKPWRMQ